VPEDQGVDLPKLMSGRGDCWFQGVGRVGLV